MAEESSPFDEVPAYLLHEITRHIPCKVDRVRALVANRSWRTSLQALPPPPLPPQLPWLLRPSAGGPTFSCLLSGADEHSVHRVRVPADLRGARYFGSYDGGWLFLASGQTSGHMLFNIRTEQRLFLPDTVSRPWISDDFPMIMLAATVSSPPSDTDEPCIGAAIVHCTPFITDARQITFWRMGSHMAIPSIPPEHPFDVVSNQFVVEEMEDVIYHKGAFHFVSKLKNVLVCRLALHQADLVVDHREWLVFAPQDDLGYPRPVATARYLVESREQLLMVLKCTCNLPGWPPLVFSVFEMTHVQAPAGAPQYAWAPVPALVGRMLFVGHGCSRSYELANFPGFQEGIYFLDDLQFYDVSRIIQYQEYLCFDNGKYTSGPPLVVSRCFWPDQVNSNYSSPVWLLPGGEDADNNAQAQDDVDMLEALHRIYRHVPCKLDRVHMLLVCRAWRASLRRPPPLPPQLPWLLVPSPRGPTFSCLLSGANELSVHRVGGVPADLLSARFFGSYDGGWIFLARRRNSGNMLSTSAQDGASPSRTLSARRWEWTAP
uniref:KIB1-4 beta-propeller domain-containing protein n=1 Tax=Oryza punctata TaxID=4537 RepID=A0A0E0L5X9_ORYPU